MVIEAQEFRERLIRLQEKLIANELDAFLISAMNLVSTCRISAASGIRIPF